MMGNLSSVAPLIEQFVMRRAAMLWVLVHASHRNVLLVSFAKKLVLQMH